MATESTSSPSTSVSLLLRGRQHDPEAQREIWSLYGPIAFQICQQTGLQDAVIGDVMQEVFLKMIRGLQTFDRQHSGSFRNFMRTITRNEVTDFRRQKKKDFDVQELAKANFSTELPPADDRDEQSRLIRRKIGLLLRRKEKTVLAFCFVKVDGRSVADVAAELGITQHNVRQSISVVTKDLKAAFSDLEDFSEYFK